MKTLQILFLTAALFLPDKLHAFYSVSERKADELKKDPFIKIKAYQSGSQTVFTVALRGTTNDAVYWLGSLELVDPTGARLATVQLRAEDIQRTVLDEVLRIWGWQSFSPAEVFKFTVESRLLAKSKLWWESGPRKTKEGVDFGGGMVQWSYLADLFEAAKEQDLARHKIKQVEIPMPPHLKESHGWMNLFDNVLQFDMFKSEIHLGRSASMRAVAEGDLEQAGFDPESLKIQWLEEGRLIWVRWKTFPQGSGSYSKQGHLVLALDGQNLKELFRDSIYAYGSAGINDSSEFNLLINYDPSTAGLTFVRSEKQRGSSDKKSFFNDHKLTTDEGYTFYYGENETRTIWKYQIENGKLRFLSGERFAKLEEDHSITAVAEAFNIPAAELRRLNPNLKNSEKARGTLRLDDRIGPYRPENDDGLCGDGPCQDD